MWPVFKDAVKQRLTELVEDEHLGVAVDQCEVQSIAPRQLKDVFDAVAITDAEPRQAAHRRHRSRRTAS